MQPTQKLSSSQYELQQADNKEFTNPKTVYVGPDEAAVISGLPSQLYFYRVRLANKNEWSTPIQVEVKHHSLVRAFGFFALGAGMFAIMIIVLIKGARERN